MTLVISSCSKRKRVPLDPTLRAKDLDRGKTREVATYWASRVAQAPATTKVKDLYGGRAFVEASNAARASKAQLLIVSAGLGLIAAENMAPAYSLTMSRRDPDCILDKTGGTAADWWAAIQRVSPMQCEALQEEQGLILAALPSAYLSMVAAAWSDWPAERLRRLRLFSKERPAVGSEALRSTWMPYDDRLDAIDAVYKGTQGDFAQRAARHFASTIEGVRIEDDRRAVSAALEGLASRDVPIRSRLSDVEILKIIDRDWEVVSGRSSAMLRRLRDDLVVACEQRRFKDLFKTVADSRAGGSVI